MNRKTIDTTWEVWTYDVWGNKQDGYAVNDRYCRSREYPMRLKVEINNPGTDMEFEAASPSVYQLQKLFGTRAKLDLEGDVSSIYVNRASDGYPLGELFCTSHGLAPIRELK